MYDDFINQFKKRLDSRRLDIKVVTTLIVLSIGYFAWAIYIAYLKKSILFVSVSSLIFIIISLITIYTIVYISVKKKNELSIKDYINVKKVLGLIRNIEQKDIIIVTELLKLFKMNTRPKVQEAIRHYQMELLCKKQNRTTLLSVISVTLAIISIIFSSINISVKQDLAAFVFLLIMTLILESILFLLTKLFYKLNIYSLKEYALIERIELALSEIWIKHLI